MGGWYKGQPNQLYGAVSAHRGLPLMRTLMFQRNPCQEFPPWMNTDGDVFLSSRNSLNEFGQTVPFVTRIIWPLRVSCTPIQVVLSQHNRRRVCATPERKNQVWFPFASPARRRPPSGNPLLLKVAFDADMRNPIPKGTLLDRRLQVA